MPDYRVGMTDERFTFHSRQDAVKHATPEELQKINAQTERASLEQGEPAMAQ